MPRAVPLNPYFGRGDIWSEKRSSKPRPDSDNIEQNAEALYGLFIYGDVAYIGNSFCENVLTIAIP
jgi:hypothetical protein